MLIKLYEENTNPRHLKQITECLNDGGIIIYPTDTLYGFGCSISRPKAISKIAQIKNVKMEHNTFSIICYDLSQMADYALPIQNNYFKAIKRCFPGPFTFIMDANNKVPKHLHRKKKQVGIRIPDNNISLSIIEMLGDPLISSSLSMNINEIEYSTDPELIYERYGDMVDIVIDGGYGGTEPSTVVSFENDEFNIIRTGKGNTELIY